MRILVVEDDEKIRSYLEQGLSQVGHGVDDVADAEQARGFLDVVSYDFAIIDLMLPEQSGEQLIRKIREDGRALPILILSAKQSVDARVEGLRAGADDYVTKPFSFSELLERIQAIQRRVESPSGDEGPPETELHAGDLILDAVHQTAQRGGRMLELRPREYALLHLLVRNRGNVVPKAVILERIWSFDFDPQTNVVDVLVHRLRKKVDEPFETPIIHTVRGVGYTLKPNET